MQMAGGHSFSGSISQSRAEKSPLLQRGFTTSSKSSVLRSCRKRTISKTVLIGPNSSCESGPKIYFCMLTFSNGNSVRKTIFKTLPSPLHPQASSCQKLAYGCNVITTQNTIGILLPSFLTPQVKDSRRTSSMWFNNLGRPCSSNVLVRPAFPSRRVCL